MFIVAPSGLGKSTLSIQMAVLWCCGLIAFGITPHKALRILIIQSEDDQGDCTWRAGTHRPETAVPSHPEEWQFHIQRVWQRDWYIAAKQEQSVMG